MFSGGMCQRVMLANALVCRPVMLIADEPTTALDVTVQAQILDLLAALQAEMGLAIIFITHDLGVVAEVCDRVAVMYAGQIVEQADALDLFMRPEHPYTAGLIASIPQMQLQHRQLGFIRGTVPGAHEWPEGCRFHPRCQYAEATCATISPTLDDLGRQRLARCQFAGSLTLQGIS
jgi:oligopeptide/dipeptide ABC transporter ATP-binding protein